MIGYQSFYQAQLTAAITDTDTDIPLDNVPTPSEGFLVIDANSASREIIYYTSKDSDSVTVPSGVGNGRGYDGTTAGAHLQNADVIMAPIAAMFEPLQDGSAILDDAIKARHIDWASTGADAGIWWEELGRTTLSVAGDTITVSGLPVRKYLVIIADVASTGGTIAASIRFNNDSANNYADRYSNDGAADTTTISQSAIDFRAGTAAYVTHTSFGEVVNVATKRKMVIHRHAGATTGAGSVPSRLEGIGLWDNATDAITRIDLVNSGTGDFAIGSEVVVLGHN